MNTQSNIRKAAVALGVVALLSGTASFADENITARAPGLVSRSVTVSFADLNLRHPAGVETLYQRLETAARQACGIYDTRDIKGVRANRACREKALTDAVARIGNDRLAKVHATRSGKVPEQRVASVQ